MLGLPERAWASVQRNSRSRWLWPAADRGPPLQGAQAAVSFVFDCVSPTWAWAVFKRK